LTLDDFSDVSLLMAMRGQNQYAFILAHDGRVLIEGPYLGLNHFGSDDLYRAFFDTVAVEVESVIQKKKKSGARWVGDGNGEVLGEMD
jgi:hypothetical protein